MGYIQISDGIDDFSQAVMSIWVKVPAASMDACLAAADGLFAAGDALAGAIPFVVFGPVLGSRFSNVTMNLPSFLGISGQPDNVTTPLSFAFHLGWDRQGGEKEPPGHVDPDNWEDVGIGLVSLNDGAFLSPDPIPFEPDVWHHILISWDFSGEISAHSQGWPNIPAPLPPITGGIGGVGHIWLALDDLDVRQENPADRRDGGIFWPCGGFDGGNGFTTSAGYDVAQTVFRTDVPHPGPPTNYSFNPNPLPGGGPFALPSADRFVDDIYEIEMAVFQLYTGVSIDTSDETARRLFVTDKGTPENPAKAIKFFGQQPVVALKHRNDWINGVNQNGTVTPDNPAGDRQFDTVVGDIKKYTPEPKLGVS